MNVIEEIRAMCRHACPLLECSSSFEHQGYSPLSLFWFALSEPDYLDTYSVQAKVSIERLPVPHTVKLTYIPDVHTLYTSFSQLVLVLLGEVARLWVIRTWCIQWWYTSGHIRSRFEASALRRYSALDHLLG